MMPTEKPDETLMIRVYNGEQKGATAFFRNRPLLRTLMPLLRKSPAASSRAAACGSGDPGDPVNLRVLFHASSIGAEVYSFAVWCQMSGLDREVALEISATDLNPVFLDFSRRAHYPANVLTAMTAEERAYFERVDEDEVTPLESVRRMVRFLPAMSFLQPMDAECDVVFVTNALTYVSEAEQAMAIGRIAAYNSRYLVLTAFHPDTIESDLRSHGYVAVTEDIEAIHHGWGERIRRGPAPLRGSAEYSWVLPEFSRIPGYEYRFCSLFKKQDQVAPG